MFGQHRQTARKERTCLLILGMSGVNRFIGVYRVISGRERKRTQVLRDLSRCSGTILPPLIPAGGSIVPVQSCREAVMYRYNTAPGGSIVPV